jgi:hypothetical protein
MDLPPAPEAQAGVPGPSAPSGQPVVVSDKTSLLLGVALRHVGRQSSMQTVGRRVRSSTRAPRSKRNCSRPKRAANSSSHR